MNATTRVDVLALPVSEAGLRAFQDLGRGPVSAEFAGAVESALCGQDAVVALEDPGAATRLLVGLAIELSDTGAVLVVVAVAEVDAMREAVARAARHAGRTLGDAGAVRVVDGGADTLPLDGVVAVLGLLGDHTPAVSAAAEVLGIHPVLWAHAPDATRVTVERAYLAALTDGDSVDAVVRVVAARSADAGLLVIVADADAVSTIAAGLASAELDALVLDVHATSPRRHAMATRARRGEVEALIATEDALRDLDGRGFGGVLFVSPSQGEAWVGRAARAREVTLLVPEADLAEWSEAVVRAGRAAVIRALPTDAQTEAKRLTRVRRAVGSHAGNPEPWHEARVRELLAAEGGVGVLAAALRVFLREEREHVVSVANLSEHHAPSTEPNAPRATPKPEAAKAAEPATAASATDAPRKKRRRRRRRPAGEAASVDGAAAGADGDEGDDDDSPEAVEDGPVEIDMADLDAVLEVE